MGQGVTATPSPRTAGVTRGREACIHAKGGVCAVHGPGAKRGWRPVVEWVMGPRGKMIKQYTKKRETYYLCDVDRNGLVRRQARLSFTGGDIEVEDNPQILKPKQKSTLNRTTTGGNEEHCAED